jgi:hypothetical protein
MYWFNALHLDVYLLVAIAVLAVAVALRRRLTLTTEMLTMRQFNHTNSVHLANIALVVRAKPGILRPPFLQPVWIKMGSGYWHRSKALGWFKDEHIEIIKQAVRTAGGELERDDHAPARLGPNPLTDPGPVLQTWAKGRLVPLLTALLLAATLGAIIAQNVREAARYAQGGWAHDYPLTAAELFPAILLVAALLTAAGRKLTLTKNTVVVRKMFGLHRIVLPLNDIVSVRQRTPSRGAPSPWQPVFIEHTNGTTISTKSLGADADAGIAAVKQAVANAGGKLESARR